MHDGNIIFLFISFILFRLGTLIVRDAHLMAMWTVLTRFFWVQSGLCCSYQRKRVLVRFGLSWSFWPKVFHVAPIKEKGMSQIELSWGDEKSCFWVMCPKTSIRSENGTFV